MNLRCFNAIESFLSMLSFGTLALKFIILEQLLIYKVRKFIFILNLNRNSNKISTIRIVRFDPRGIFFIIRLCKEHPAVILFYSLDLELSL